MLRLLLLLLLVAPIAQAQTIPLPHEYSSEESLELFKDCRAAILIEREVRGLGPTALPDGVVDAMQEQMNMIIAEALLSPPLFSKDDAQGRLAFMESWFLTFGQTVRRQMAELQPKEVRRDQLLLCQEMIWHLLSHQIEAMMKARAAGQPLPEPIPSFR
ncbi:MAG: hypothetical protein AAGC79_04480 [Pseudomonadota bacterium]